MFADELAADADDGFANQVQGLQTNEIISVLA
jgi:hypothetical protein